MSDTARERPSGDQLPLFPGVAGPRAHEDRGDRAPEPITEGPEEDSGQLELFADYAVLARELELAVSDGRFGEAARVHLAIAQAFGLPETPRELDWLGRLAATAWEGPPAVPLSVWAEIDRQLCGQPSLQDRVRRGAFTRLLRTHTSRELMEASPDCLPVLVRALGFQAGRSIDEARVEARALIRDSLLAGRRLEGLDFREDEALAELLAEDLSPRWLACLGRIRRLWPSSPLPDAERRGFLEVVRGQEGSDDPAMAFWRCLCLAETPDCPEELVHAARRRMKQLHPGLHAAFMRRLPVA